MMIHKRTMGVLECIWEGQYRHDRNGYKIPLEKQVKLSDFPTLNPDDWWEIQNDCALAKRLKAIYPFCSPVTGLDGELVDMLPWEQNEDIAIQEEQQRRREEAQRRGYCQAGRVRPKHLMPFLRGGD